MTATVVKQNLDFVGNPANKSPLLGLFMPIGATVTANNGTRTVTVTTNTPQPFMIQGLALVQLVCSKGLANRSILDHGTDGTGPYKLTGAVPGDHYTFSVRKGYTWGPGGATTAVSGLPAKVTVKVVTNETTAANLLLTGGLNVASIGGPDRTRLNKANLFSTRHRGPAERALLQREPGASRRQPRGSQGARAGAEPRSARHGRDQRPRAQDDAALAAELHAVRGQLRRRQRPGVQPVGGALRARRARASSCSTRPTQGPPTRRPPSSPSSSCPRPAPR